MENNKAIFISISSMLKQSQNETISKNLVSKINELIEKTHSELILSDSHNELKKLDKSVEFLFKKNGFSKKPKNRVSDISARKADRIEHFFMENDLDKFIIFDCENINSFKARFIKCSEMSDISEKLYNTALALLN